MRHWLATADFETRSRLNLKKVGAWRYSTHPSTSALCLSYALDDGSPRRWKPGDPDPDDLFAALEDGALFEAHNSFFEWCIWHNVMVKRHGWPPLKWRRVVCSAARAAVACLPRALENALIVAGLEIRKGDDRAMKLLSSPRKPTKKDPREWRDDPQLYSDLYDYCDQDVRCEHALSRTLPALSRFERRVFLADMLINLRGILCDRRFVEAAIKVAGDLDRKISSEMTQVTRGEVMAVTERDRLVGYLRTSGLDVDSIDKEAVDDLLYHTELTKNQRRVLELRQEGARSSISKYKSFLEVMDVDEVVRGLYVYYGANAHGRFAARLIQPQNFPRGDAKGEKDEKSGDLMERMVREVIHAAKTGDPDHLRRRFYIEEHKVPGDPKSGTQKVSCPPAEVLSTSLRGVFIARPGKHFGVGDYSAIELRVLFWLADETYGLSLMRAGKDIYRDMGSVIFGKKPEDLDTGFERMMGKTTVLGCGYGMWVPKFKKTCKKAYGMLISDDLAMRCVKGFRGRYKRVPEWWKELHEAAHRCVRNQSDQYVSGRRIKFSMRDGDLVITLPSGREIYHRRARISRDNDLMYINGKGWPENTYGGKLCEYICSGTARDILADAIVKAEFDRDDVDPVMHSHDELVVEGEPGKVEAVVKEIMDDMPAWTKGLPMKIETWEGPRYHK